MHRACVVSLVSCSCLENSSRHLESTKHNDQIDIGGWAKLSLSGTAKQGDGTEVIAEGIASGLKKISEDLLHFGRKSGFR